MSTQSTAPADRREPTTGELVLGKALSIKRHPPLHSVPPDKQRHYLELARIVEKYVALRRENGGRLPHGAREAAATELGVTPRQASQMIDEYEAYPILYPGEPAVNVLIPISAGRPKERKLTADQEHVAVYAYLGKEWVVVNVNGKAETRRRMRLGVKHVHRLLMSIWPELQISEKALWRFLRAKEDADPALFALGRKGEKYFYENYVVKRKVDFKAPDMFWLYDDRSMPSYIRVGNDLCKGILGSIQDGDTGVALGQRVIATKVPGIDGVMRKVGVTAFDVRSLLIAAIYRWQRRPYYVYADNAKVNELLDEVLPYLSIPGEDEVRTQRIPSRKGRPQGRGRHERHQALVDDVLRRQNGFVENEKDPYAWREAYQYWSKHIEELPTREELQREVDAYYEQVINTKPARDGMSRVELYESFASVALPAPEPVALARLGLSVVWTEAPVHDSGILYDKRHYLPTTEEGYRRITNNVKKKVPFCIIPISEDDNLTLACLDGITFEEVADLAKIRISDKEHWDNQEQSQRAKVAQLDEGLNQLSAIVREHYRSDAMPAFKSTTGDIVPVPRERLLKAGLRATKSASPGRRKASDTPPRSESEPTVGAAAGDESMSKRRKRPPGEVASRSAPALVGSTNEQTASSDVASVTASPKAGGSFLDELDRLQDKRSQ